MKKVKIIGAGSIGNHLAQACRRMEWGVTMCDADPAALQRTKESIYPTRYGSWDEGIQLCTADKAPRGGFDMIFIGTPPDSHMSLALQALEEKPKLIQIEKPVCPPSLENAQDLFGKANKAGVAVCIGFDHALGENTVKMEGLLTEGFIGKVETLDVEFREYWGGIFAAHPWLSGPADSYLGFWKRGGGSSSEHSHATNLWQHFSHFLKAGKITTVSATVDYFKDGKAEYDRITALTVKTENGLLGRIIQDVVTRPPRKWAKVQGDKGYIEWHNSYRSGADAVVAQREGEEKREILLPKKRPDDFYREMIHFDKILNGEIKTSDSPVSLERGLDTVLVIAAAHKSSQEKRTVTIDYTKGYRLEALC